MDGDDGEFPSKEAKSHIYEDISNAFNNRMYATENYAEENTEKKEETPFITGLEVAVKRCKVSPIWLAIMLVFIVAVVGASFGIHADLSLRNGWNVRHDVWTNMDGGWSDWSSWSDCTHTCGPGIHARSRNCTDPVPSNGGKHCEGEPYELTACNNTDCPVNGGWTEWSSWSGCSRTCGQGETTRTRSCSNPAPYSGGMQCEGITSELSACNSHACPVNGGWTEWGPWSSCTHTCGLGDKSRMRSCTNPAPADGGKHCEGENFVESKCHNRDCPYSSKGASAVDLKIMPVTILIINLLARHLCVC